MGKKSDGFWQPTGDKQKSASVALVISVQYYVINNANVFKVQGISDKIQNTWRLKLLF